jgi:sugar phosphate isomerase/epimerase
MQRSFSLSFLTCLDAPPPSAIRTAASTGYDFVGLRLMPALPGGVAFELMNQPALMTETLAALQDTGVKVFDVEMIRIGPDFSPDAYKPLLETSARLGARAILVAGDDADESRMTASFAGLCNVAAPYGLSMDLEFMPQSKVRDLQAALRILRGAERSNSSVIVDTLHVSRARTTVAEIAAIPRHWLNYAQICDGSAAIPTSIDELNRVARHDRLLPGDGAIDLTGIFSALPPDLPVAVEIPNDRQAPALGAVEWARRALAASKVVLSAAELRQKETRSR